MGFWENCLSLRRMQCMLRKSGEDRKGERSADGRHDDVSRPQRMMTEQPLWLTLCLVSQHIELKTLRREKTSLQINRPIEARQRLRRGNLLAH